MKSVTSSNQTLGLTSCHSTVSISDEQVLLTTSQKLYFSGHRFTTSDAVGRYFPSVHEREILYLKSNKILRSKLMAIEYDIVFYRIMRCKTHTHTRGVD